MPDPSSEGDEFFVGYLPTPPKLRRMLIGISLLLLFAAGALAAAIAVSQRDPGSGVWKDSELASLEGTLLLDPYPILQTTDQRMVLLVGVGKHGVVDRLKDLEGRMAKLDGYLLERNGWTMLELEDAVNSVRASGSSSGGSSTSTYPISEPRTFRGEIIDPKCYLGAMKPGDGKTHKACATLCIRGGIPPALVTTDSSGSASSYLLLDSSGHGLRGADLEQILPFVGDPVELSGTIREFGPLRMLVLHSGSIRRR